MTIKYRQIASLRAQIEFLAASYLRHGGKRSRRKRIKNLISACEAIKIKFNCKDVRQIGQKQIHWFDEQLRQSGHANKTRMDYWYGWCQLWEWLHRAGKPIKPKLKN